MSVRVETPQKIRFLKFIFKQGSSVKSGDIAAEFGIRTATVTRSLHELGKAGYILYDPYQTIELTESGTILARYLFRRHRILSLMFTRSGLSQEDACGQAEKIEHLVPREYVDTICCSLGHPSRSACGTIEHDPICCGISDA